MQKTASKRLRWYIAANLFFVFLLIGHLVSFTNNLRKVNTETQIHEFLVSTDGAKRKVRDYMETSSRTLRDWKKLIGLNDWTAEEPGWIEYLNSKGQETLYAYSTDSQWGWTLIASIEMKALQGASVQWTILIVSGFTFGMLYLVNSAYFRSLNRQLRSSLTQLEAANSAKTRFLSSMSHDIRTPMNAILGMTAIAEKQLNDRERLEDCLHKIDLAGNHLLTLVNDILDISQIESGRLTFRPSVFSLEESAADLVNLLYHQAEDKHFRAEVHILDAHQNYLYADKGRLNQIWINLLSNAIKYTPDGGRVDIYLDEKDIPGQPEQVRLTFQVKDTGVGMSQEFQKVLFDSFTRGKDSRIDTIQGSGLGMAIPDVYKGSILAFFEGDVPFLAFNSEGFSGMAKRESKSEHFSAQPFDYAFAVIPVSGEEAAISAGFLPGLALVEGSANQDWGAEFLRFLCQKSELDKMAAVTRDSAGDARFAQLDTVPAARRVNQDISSDHSWVDECMQRCLDGILRGTLEDVEAARAHYERSIRHET